MGEIIIERISTGIDDLDIKLNGGYPKNRAILVTGSTGVGKTIFGLHFLHRSCTEGKKCVLIATEELPDDIFHQAKIIGLNLEDYYNSGQLIIEGLFEIRAQRAENVKKYGFMPEGLSVELPSIVNSISEDTDVVVVDNLGAYTLSLSVQDFKDQFDALNFIFIGKSYTSLFIMDDVSYNIIKQVADYSVYGLIRLMVKENPYTGKVERYISIPKVRSTNISLDLIVFDITSEGIIFLRPQQEQ